MRYLSVCSGIEAATVAWHSLGWTPAGFAEIEAFPSAVLAHHYGSNLPGQPLASNGVPNFGDMTRFKDWPDAAFDVLVGGTPCQSFSVAGLRKGMADPRGNLALVYLAIADRYRPQRVVWENVPGVLSSNGGRDFGAFLGGLAELGYGWAYRVLDAQYVRVDGFGRAVPQRRRRVFVVGDSGGWRRAAAVLFEPESLSGNPPPRRQAGQGLAGSVTASSARRGGVPAADDPGSLIASTGDVSHCLNAGGMGRQDYETETETVIAHALRADGFDASEDGTGRGTPLVPVGPYTLAIRGRGDTHQLEYREDGTANAILTPNGGRAGIGVGAVAFNITPSNSNKDYNARESDHAQALTGGGNRPSARGGDLIASSWAVRRLTPRECERLQGFPDGYTDVPYRGKQAADGPRYKALGNSMAVNCMRWIGMRIALIDQIARAA